MGLSDERLRDNSTHVGQEEFSRHLTVTDNKYFTLCCACVNFCFSFYWILGLNICPECSVFEVQFRIVFVDS